MSLPMHHWHVAQERAFFSLATKLGPDSVTPVVMGLPFAVGNGAGPIRKWGFVHEYVAAMKRRETRKPFVMGKGQNIWSWACPQDIAAAIEKIVDEWKRDENKVHLSGYYYVEAGELEMQVLARCVGQTLTQEAQYECESLQYPQFAEIMPTLPGLWGVSARCQADRLRKLGWKPKNNEWKPLVNDCTQLTIPM
ncbi:hypothetical protein LZ30DRAFT_693204 [Colletotrichum cereale]|nr:hypothetical protein LZ30DRAFT_693204 [Colletotrichum cereale]